MNGFYWLLVPSPDRGGLAGMPRPNAEALSALPENGVGLVVSLLERSRMTYRAPAGLRLVHLPVDDGSVPADIHFPIVARLCAFIHRHRLQPLPGNSVAVHCLGGLGRTGMLLAAYRAYVAAVYPRDPNAALPEDTAREIARHLRRVYGAPVPGPGANQLRWVAHFHSRLRMEADPAWDAAAVAELSWAGDPAPERREPGVSSVWGCPECGGRAVGRSAPWPNPFWCPCCGLPTGSDG